jgi:8-oxo-dGTP pyrophosphatase MutT (NUDIX family)
MNKKIYFNNKFLAFETGGVQTSQNQSIRYLTEFSKEKLKPVIDELLSEEAVSGNQFYTAERNFEQVLDYLKKDLYYIEAAGGLIKKEKECLFIYRLGRWDLPKGKLDKGETTEHAAVRECEEECGISELSIERPLSSTFHIYKYKDHYAIKKTYWYFMSTRYNRQLAPQTEENIEEVKWFGPEEIKKVVFANSYFTIQDVVNEAISLKLI